MNELVSQDKKASALELALVSNDISKLSPVDRVFYISRLCESLGLNPLTKPFEIIPLKGKETLYATKSATDQLRALHKISIYNITEKIDNEVVTITAYARDHTGREDTDIGSVTIKGLSGEALANARMKCLTKAKRRVTLSICGLGMMDETEIESARLNRQPREVTQSQVKIADVIKKPEFEALVSPSMGAEKAKAFADEIEFKETTPIVNNWGEYVFKTGNQARKDKMIKDLDSVYLAEILDWFVEQIGAGKTFSDDVMADFNAVASFLEIKSSGDSI